MTMPESRLPPEAEERLQREFLRMQLTAGLHLKRSEKGAVSVYGLGRFPTTLYKRQWARVIALMPEIEKFIREHDHELA